MMKMFVTTIILLFLPSITVVNATGNLQNCDSYRENLKKTINGWRNRGAGDNTVINFICDSSFKANLLEEMNNGLQGTPVLTIDLTPRCEMRRSSDNRLCREIFAEESVQDRANCVKHNGCIYDEAKCRGEGGCASVDLSGAANAAAAAKKCRDHNDKCHYEPAPGTNVCIQKDLNGNFYNNPKSRNLLEQAFRGDTQAECREAVQSELNYTPGQRQGGSPVLDYVAIVLDANDWEEDNFDTNEFAETATEKKDLILDLLYCVFYRDNFKKRINGWRNRGASDNTVINFICDSSFKANLLEEINNGLQGTPVLTIDLTPRCEMRRSSDNGLCREIFAEESVKDRANCIKHDGCIYEAANAVAAAQRCLDHNDECHYEPAPGTNACIQRDLNGFFYNNPESRNLLKQTFRGETEADCREAVQSELNYTPGRRLNEIGDSPILDYVAIVLDANDWEEDNFDANAFAAAVWEKEDLITGVLGSWYFEDEETIRGWSCDKFFPIFSNTVWLTFGEDYNFWNGFRGELCGGRAIVTADLPTWIFGIRHGFEFKLTDVQRNCINDGDGQVYVRGMDKERVFHRLLPESTGNRINDRLGVKDRSASRSRDSSSFSDLTNSIEQGDLNEVEQEIMKELDDVEEEIIKRFDNVGDDNNNMH